MCEFQDAYDEGVGEAQAFIDRHPHGYPAMTMEQYGKPVRPEDELEAEHMRGWFERLGDERHRGGPERELEAEDAGVRPVARLDRLSGNVQSPDWCQ